MREEFSSEETIKNLLQILDESGSKPIDKVFNEIFPSRFEAGYCLVAIAKEKKYSEKQRILAMKQLGLMREDASSNILVDNLSLGYKGPIQFEELTSSNFPVGFALIRMGPSKTIRTHLLNKITYSDDEVIRLCAFVLMKIEDKDVAGFILKREIDKEKNAKQKANLEKALSFLE
ncbi:MAG: hypothetical protein V1747_11165 [Candidatus Omnitrophota bacterium]